MYLLFLLKYFYYVYKIDFVIKEYFLYNKYYLCYIITIYT